MAKTLNKLSPPTIKSLMTKVKREGKAVKVADGGGLYFVAEPVRSSWWRFDYRSEGKQKTLSLGIFPEVSLPDARDKRAKLRSNVANGIDPGQQRKAERASQSGADSFEVIAREWWAYKRDNWTPGHADRTLTIHGEA
ncbi:MAG: tyrosine-type recombinase/integrase [Methylobacter sp.]